MLEALLFNHIWGNKNIEPLQRCGANGRTQHSSKMQINEPKYLCSALWADPSSHTPPASPWAAPLTCRHTFKWDHQNPGYYQNIYGKITEEERLAHRSRSPISISFWLMAALICESLLMIRLKSKTNRSSAALIWTIPRECWINCWILRAFSKTVPSPEIGQLGNGSVRLQDRLVWNVEDEGFRIN